MKTNLRDKLRRELGSFYALAIMNIVFGGIAMALGIDFGVKNVLVLTEVKNLLLPQLAFTVIGFLAFGLSLRWLVSSAEILDGVSDSKNDYEKMKLKLDDENITALIVKMMAYYRDNKSTIHKLSWLSRIAGVCFIISGIILLTNNIMAAKITSNVFTVIGTILYFAVGVSGIIVPHFFKNYSSVWEYRLKQSVEAEKELEKELEGKLQ